MAAGDAAAMEEEAPEAEVAVGKETGAWEEEAAVEEA